MLHKLLAGHRNQIRSILGILLCLVLVCGTVASFDVFATETAVATETEEGTGTATAEEKASEETSEGTIAAETSSVLSETTAAETSASVTETTDTGSSAESTDATASDTSAALTDSAASAGNAASGTSAELTETTDSDGSADVSGTEAEAQTGETSGGGTEVSTVSDTNTTDEADEDASVEDAAGTEAASETKTEADEEENESSTSSKSSSLSLESGTAATADDGISLAATYSYSYTVTAGSSVTISSSDVSSANQGSWSTSDSSVATVSTSGNVGNVTVTITGVSEGTATITHTWGGRQSNDNTATYTVTVTAASSIVTVYVFVAGYDYETGEYFSQDMLDLLNVNTLDGSGYFAAGTLELDLSQLSGTTSSMITSDEEWAYVLSELATNLNTSNSITCPDNLIASYADQVLTDTGVTQNQGYSGLWLAGGHSNITEVSGSAVGSQYWHLDIRFQTVTITYIYGENGITASDSSVAYDYNTAGSKVFIQGATMDYTPTIEAPDGWKIVGYYTTPDFQEGTEWDAVGQPIIEDTTVYIKIVPEDDVVINYVVAEGVGTVTNPSNENTPVQSGYENFNPTTGSPVGSTAAAGTGYEFDGWYSDANCTDLVSSDEHYTPTEPSDGWQEDDVYTYYAKFVPTTTSVTVTKVWDDEGSNLRPTSITVKLYADDATTATDEATITGSGDIWTYTFTDLPEYNYSYEGGPATTKIVYTAEEDAVANYISNAVTNSDGSITVTNTLSTATLTLKKIIKGNSGETTKEFKFEVSYTNGSGQSVVETYYLANGDSNENNPLVVQIGSTVTITEENGVYDVTATVNDVDANIENGNSITFTINEDTSVVVTNTYNAYPDTGVNLDSVPYIMLLFGVAVLGATVLISRRRKLL